MTGERKIRSVQIVLSDSSYRTLQDAVKSLREKDSTMSLSRFAREALKKHFRETFGYDLDVETGEWGGPRNLKSPNSDE